jgi:hypothetical protein
MEDTNQSILCTQYLPSLCPISKSISGWYLKSSIKVMYFVTTKNIKSYIEPYIRLNYSLFQSVSKSLHIPHRLCPLLKQAPPLLPVQFTQSSLRTAAMPIVCSVYAVKLSVFSFHLFLVFPCPESQSLTRATPRVHQHHQTFIPQSPITRHSLLHPLFLTNHCHCHSPPLILHLQKQNSTELFTVTRTSF